MKVANPLLRYVAGPCVVGLLAFGSALAQQAAPQAGGSQAPAASPPPGASEPSKTEYQPTRGQQGKDVVWVPTSDELVGLMLDAAKVTPDDYVIDLGSGDGRTVIAAAKRGARALGVEYNPDMVELSKRAAEKAGVSDKTEFVKADLFETDFSKATVITMFLLPDINLKLRPKILDMKAGTRVVSNTFTMGDWAPDQTIEAAGDCTSFCKAYFWVVPAKVAGKWRLDNGELTLDQKYQTVSGTLQSGGRTVEITEGKLRGEEITFKAGERTYVGRVNGNVIEGTAEGGGSKGEWRAMRA